jgi:hypothetical protein
MRSMCSGRPDGQLENAMLTLQDMVLSRGGRALWFVFQVGCVSAIQHAEGSSDSGSHSNGSEGSIF